MPKKKEKKTREEKLIQARLHKRKIYQEIKNDPEKYQIQKEKERLRYLKRKEEKKIKSVADMTPREQRLQRKRWKLNSKRCLENKKKNKKISEVLIDSSASTSNEAENIRQDPLQESSHQVLDETKSCDVAYQIKNENIGRLRRGRSRICEEKVEKLTIGEQDPLEKSTCQTLDDPPTSCKSCLTKLKFIHRLRYSTKKQIGKLKLEKENIVKEKDALKKVVARLKKTNKDLQKVKTPSTEQKVDTLIKTVDTDKREEIKKKNLFIWYLLEECHYQVYILHYLQPI